MVVGYDEVDAAGFGFLGCLVIFDAVVDGYEDLYAIGCGSFDAGGGKAVAFLEAVGCGIGTGAEAESP